MNNSTKAYGVKVGKYTIWHYEGELWIEGEGGEGGQFNEEELEKVIEKFYNDNF